MTGVVRLADGVVVGRGLRVWASGPDGVPVPADAAGDRGGARVRHGAAVAVGPASASDTMVDAALGALADLVRAGGVVAAGAGVELGHGFWSARLAGARGDRRDAVLAALRVVGVDGAHRLGDRVAVLVSLFGPVATKPVGAAAARAVADGRWTVLQLASAASELLGPEQLEQVLALPEPPGAAAEPQGTASVLAGHLAHVLGGLSRPRRLALLLDLWRQVGEHHALERRRERRLAIHGRQDRLADLTRRYHQFIDDQVVASVRASLGHEPTLAEAARWIPAPWHLQTWFIRLMHDGLAATVLLRAAVAVADHGLDDGLARCREQLAAAPFLLSSEAAGQAARRVPGLLGIPARPGCYVRQLHERLRGDAPIDWSSTTEFVRQRLARAREYGLVVHQAVVDHLSPVPTGSSGEAARHWDCGHLVRWRAVAGYTPQRPPATWEQPPLDSGTPTLAERLRGRPDAQPADVETPGDLLWFGELGDAIAQLNGHDAAAITYGPTMPAVDTAPASEPDPLRPRLDSVQLAVAGAAQLVSMGAEVPARPRTWTELVDGLLAATAVAEALTGSFPVPAPLAARDGSVIPGTRARLELARDPHQLADWAAYMGNCIAGSDFLDAAREGRCVLAALRDPAGRILANVGLMPPRSTTGRWRITDLKARFNADPDVALADRLAAWVATIPPATPARARQPARSHARARDGTHRRNRRLREVGQRLDALAGPAVQDAEAVGALAVLGGPRGLAGVTALRRATAGRLDATVRDTLTTRRDDLSALWWATGVRPLATALAGVEPHLWKQAGHLDLLLADAPLPAALRRLARLPGVAAARSVDLVARRLRGAIGRLARALDPVLTTAIAEDVDTGMLCALILAVSTTADPPAYALTPVSTPGSAAVPGGPESSRTGPTGHSGPWQRAWRDAVELGADPALAGTAVQLRVPSAWLAAGGWPALWARATRNTARATDPGARA
jgi:hypothetical protein